METYVCRGNEFINGVTDPLQVHCWLRKVFACNVDVSMLSLLTVQQNTCSFGRIGGPSRTGQQFYLVNSQVASQRQLGDWNNDSSFRGERVFFACVVDRPYD